MLKIRYSSQSIKFLKKCDKIILKRILNKIESLSSTPFPPDIKVIHGEKLFRVRVGKIRILYEVDYKNNLIGIIRINKRSKIY